MKTLHLTPSIISVEIFGSLDPNQVYRCFFTDYTFRYSEENVINKSVVKDCTSILYNVPDRNLEYHCFRLDFGFNEPDSILLDSILITYSDNKLLSYSAKESFKRVNYSHLISEIEYYETGSAVLFFDFSPGFAPYVEFSLDNRNFLFNSVLLTISCLSVFLLFLVYFRAKIKESFLFFLVALGFFSFFSTIIVNNIFIISICLISLYYGFKEKKIVNSDYILVIGFVLLFIIKLVWSFLPSSTFIFLKSFEKYLTFLVVPMSFLFLPISNHSSLLIIKGIFISFIILLYSNIMSLIIYDFNLVKTSYPNVMFIHYFDFVHSSYIAYFYALGLISGFYLLQNKLLNKYLLYLIFVIYFIFCFAAEARIGLVFGIVLLIGNAFILYLKKEYNNKLLIFFGIIFFLVAFWFPFSNIISWVDESRGVLWEIGKNSIKHNYAIGLGTGSNLVVYSPQNLSNFVNNGLEKGLSNAHNQLINEMIQHGIIVGSGIYLFLFILLYFSIKTKKYLLVTFVIISTTFMTTEVITDRSRGIAFFVFVICLLYNMPINDMVGNKSKIIQTD